MKECKKCKKFKLVKEESINKEERINKRVFECVKCGKITTEFWQENSDKEYEKHFQEILKRDNISAKDKYKYLQYQKYFDDFGFKMLGTIGEGLCPNGHLIKIIDKNTAMCKCGYGRGIPNS